MACCHDTVCSSHAPSGALNSSRWRRALWIALFVNAAFFVGEIAAGVAAGSASLQADALDFFGDAANYAISLLVISMALRVRAIAALGKGITMGVIGIAAFAANAGSFALLWAYRAGDANMRSAWICTRNDAIGNLAVLA